jgi:hypothetical protein
LSLCRRRARAVGFMSPRGQAADVCTNVNAYTRGVEPLCSPCPTRVHTLARTRVRERARQRRHPSPCHRVTTLRRATPSLTTAQRAYRPYHALVLVGQAADALFACWHFHFSFRRLAGALSTAGDLCFLSDPRPRHRELTPAKIALFSTLSVP